MSKLKQVINNQLPFFFSAPALLWQVLFFGLPLLIMLFMSFVDRSLGRSVTALTLGNYLEIIDAVHLKIILNSIGMALCVASIALLIAYPTAYFLTFYAGRFKHILSFLLLIPFWTNLLVLIYAWFFILERDGFINSFLKKIGIVQEPVHLLHSLFAIALVMFYCYLPFMIMPLLGALEKIDRSLIEASLDLGATGFQTVRKVIIPLSWPGIRTGFFLVYVLAFGEFAIPLLMGGDRYVFVGNGIAHYVLAALEIEKGAAFTCVSGLVLALTIAVLYRLLSTLVRRL
jgi:spermidine/putrescine transport system permease protein